MDIYGLLKADHQRVKELFAELEAAEESHDRERLFEALRRELAQHKEAEERTFYAALSVLPEISDRIEEAMDEHADIQELVDELDGLDAEDEDFAAQLAELREEVEHHVEAEESEIFERARELLTSQQARKIAEEFTAEKERLRM